MYTPLPPSWNTVFTRDTELTANTVVFIDGYEINGDSGGRLDAVHTSVVGETFIGGFNMLLVEIDVYIVGIEDENIDIADWVGKSVDVQEGYETTDTIPKGNLTVDSIEINDNGTSVRVTAVDNAYKFDTVYEPLDFPLTGREIVEEITLKVGVGLAPIPLGEELLFDDYTFNSINVNEGQNISYRQIINNYAQINGVLAMIDRQGRLMFKDVITGTPVSGYEIEPEHYETINVQETLGPINSLKLARTDSNGEEDYDSIVFEDEASVIANGRTQLRISNNIFIDMIQEEVLEDIFNRINGYSYNPISIEGWYPNFALDQGDLVPVVDLDGITHVVPYMNADFDFGGGIDGSFSIVALPETLPDYTLEGINQRLQRTELRVDRVANTVSALAQTQEALEGTLDEQIGRWQLTDERLETEITNRQSEDDRILAEASLLVSQTADTFMLEFTRIDGKADGIESDLEVLKTTYQITADGALIGKDEDPFQLTLSNSEIGFLDSGSVIAYINGQKMYIESLEILQSIILGYHQIEKYDGAYKGSLIRMIGE